MHDLCMATKTISLELDAYDKLKSAKLTPRESFSAVVRRGLWEKPAYTAKDLLKFMEERAARGTLFSEKALDKLDEAQARPRISSSHWKDG